MPSDETTDATSARSVIPLAQQESRLLERVNSALASAVELKRWWERVDDGEVEVERFDLISTFNRPDHSFDFFGGVPQARGELPVMGSYQEMFYDHPKARPARRRMAATWTQEQIREFALHYLMRVSDFRQPEARVESGHKAPPLVLRPFSWCPRENVQRGGFGFRQLYYKRCASGEIGRFPEAEQFAIVDQREIGEQYEWIVLRVRIFDFSLDFRPLGSAGPNLRVPLDEQSYLVVSREFLADETRPGPGVLGRYGIGYAFVRDPAGTDLLAYGPGQLEPAFQQIHFEVLESGDVRAKLVFVVNRPDKILNINIDPLDWGFRLADLMSLGQASRVFAPFKEVFDRLPRPDGSIDPIFGYVSLANLLSGGLASRELCISREQLEKDFLVQHYMQHYEMVVGSLLTWRQIPDWLDGAALPRWVVTGLSA